MHTVLSPSLASFSHQIKQTTYIYIYVYIYIYGCGSKNRYQNGTLVSGNMDQNLRNPSCLILIHSHIYIYIYQEVLVLITTTITATVQTRMRNSGTCGRDPIYFRKACSIHLVKLASNSWQDRVWLQPARAGSLLQDSEPENRFMQLKTPLLSQSQLSCIVPPHGKWCASGSGCSFLFVLGKWPLPCTCQSIAVDSARNTTCERARSPHTDKTDPFTKHLLTFRQNLCATHVHIQDGASCGDSAVGQSSLSCVTLCAG